MFRFFYTIPYLSGYPCTHFSTNRYINNSSATAATMSPSTTAVTSPPSAASTPSSPHVAASAHNQPSFPAYRQQEGHAHPENAQEKVAVVPEKIVEITVERIEDLKKDEFKTRALKCLKFLFVFVGVVCVVSVIY